ncbi:YvbH-like oligomerization domain-containing protein [Chryseobacterium lathyri]
MFLTGQKTVLKDNNQKDFSAIFEKYMNN